MSAESGGKELIMAHPMFFVRQEICYGWEDYETSFYLVDPIDGGYYKHSFDDTPWGSHPDGTRARCPKCGHRIKKEDWYAHLKRCKLPTCSNGRAVTAADVFQFFGGDEEDIDIEIEERDLESQMNFFLNFHEQVC
jgi:hypothetical protein